MPAHGHYGRTRSVRYDRREREFKMLCETCQRYWPLDLEFWAPSQLQRCRACDRVRRRVRDAGRVKDPAQQHAYYMANRSWIRPKDNARRALARAARIEP